MSNFYFAQQQSPVALHAAASLYHFEAVAPARARIMELGCGQGDSLIANALSWPESMALGIDINPDDIACGHKRIEQFALTNVELHHAGMVDLLASDLGIFDYIIVRDHFSLMGGEKRAALLNWCQRHLSQNGLVAFHWQVLPGAQDSQTLQKSLSFHANSASGNDAQLDALRGMLSYLAMTLPDGALKDQVNFAEKSNDLSLAYRFLRNVNHADYFANFHEEISQHRFTYLGDAVPQYEVGNYFGEQTGQLHGLISDGQTRINAQQYLDFAVNRSERFSLLTHESLSASANSPELKSVEHLHWAGCFKRDPNHLEVIVNGRVANKAALLTINNEITLQVLDVLTDVWPLSMNFEQLLFHCRLPEESNSNTRFALIESLQSLLAHTIDGLMISAVPSAYNDVVGDRLHLFVPVDKSMFEEKKETRLFNAWGQTVCLRLEEWEFAISKRPFDCDSDWLLFCTMREKGLLTGSLEAWRKALQVFMKSGDADVIKQVCHALLIFSCEKKYGGFQNEINLRQSEDTENETYNDLYSEINELIGQGLSKEGAARVESLLKDNADNIHLLRCKARTSMMLESWETSLPFTCRLLAQYPLHWDSYFDLATVLTKTGDSAQARKLLRALLRIDDKNASCWNLMARIYHDCRDMSRAEKCARESLRGGADNPLYLAIMGIILSDNQKVSEARYFLEKSLSLKSPDFDTYTSLLFVMSHDETITSAELFAAHCEYGRQVTKWVASHDMPILHKNDLDPDRKLRIGFVSADLREHPVSNFFLPFWNNMDRDNFDLIAYSTTEKTDQISDHFAQSATLWRKVNKYSAVNLTKQIVEDSIDILIDLSGHTTQNRLPVFGFKPAPVQMTWIGYPGTTGLEQIDYRITTPGLGKPGEMDDQYTEKLIYMPLRNFFEPSPLSPEVNMLPALTNGYFTYGSFNRPKKLNDAVFALWAQIMIFNPLSKLMIGFMDDDEMIARFRKKLCALGVQDEQLIFRKTTTLEKYLHMHHEVDLLLDTFPYTGGTTTSHAIWMGVPTLSIAGETTASRQSVETMHIYGLQSFIASSQKEYVEKAVAWQGNLHELDRWRQNMRSNIPTHDTGFNVAAPLEKGLRKAWQNYCAGLPAQSFTVEE
ncbi:hypothetical protein BZY71_23710 [Leclercia adecarboxylata]|uniref:O-linked N-acetylglucosamine transferase family protein n=1 Tax=Leclercia adecarboxylata TaxID=83655 RepID=UPI0009D04671|nr:methyltransferase regulatory domain-containing protein [Leclercia adecarboxylata]OOB84653.1 hypothetical protein BZY71_23710 [Leclercia adecarboxylata]